MDSVSLVVTALLLASSFTIALVSDNSKISVVATLDVFASLAKRIGGDYVTADYIVPSGTDIHSYSLTSADVGKINNADLVILASSEFFSLDSQIKENSQGKVVLDFNDYNATLLPLGDMEKNPHGYWLYPDNAIGIANAIQRTLTSMDPEHASYYLRNYEAFVSEVNNTLEIARGIVKESGMVGKGVLLAVPGTFYIAKALGLDIRGVLVEGPNQFPSQSDMNRYVNEIENGDISLILNAQNLEGSKAGQIAIELSRMTGVRVAYIEIFSADNYTELLLHDSSVIASAPYISSYESQSCDVSAYIYTIASLFVLLAIVSYVAYRYRRNLLE